MQPGRKRYIVYAGKATVLRYWQLADLHLGNRACAVNRLQRDVDEIKNDPFSFWIGGGDYAEYISPADKRFDASAVSPAMI